MTTFTTMPPLSLLTNISPLLTYSLPCCSLPSLSSPVNLAFLLRSHLAVSSPVAVLPFSVLSLLLHYLSLAMLAHAVIFLPILPHAVLSFLLYSLSPSLFLFLYLAIGFFFITVGFNIDLALIMREWPRIAAIFVAMIAGKTAIITVYLITLSDILSHTSITPSDTRFL